MVIVDLPLKAWSQWQKLIIDCAGYNTLNFYFII